MTAPIVSWPTVVVLAVVFDMILLSIGLYALVRGDRPEKIGALVNLSAVIASSGFRLIGLATWAAGGWTVMIDLAVAASFLWLGCRTTRFWPIWSLGSAVAIVAIDVARLAMPRASRFSFETVELLYIYLALGSLALGTFRASRTDRDENHGFRMRC